MTRMKPATEYVFVAIGIAKADSPSPTVDSPVLSVIQWALFLDPRVPGPRPIPWDILRKRLANFSRGKEWAILDLALLA